MCALHCLIWRIFRFGIWTSVVVCVCMAVAFNPRRHVEAHSAWNCALVHSLEAGVSRMSVSRAISGDGGSFSALLTDNGARGACMKVKPRGVAVVPAEH